VNQPPQNNAAAFARAFATYALVPYLGIIFCLGAVLMGTIAVAKSHRAHQAGAREGGYIWIVSGLLILGIQLLLWWILYRIPEWAKGL
jgi:hypothetical protein